MAIVSLLALVLSFAYLLMMAPLPFQPFSATIKKMAKEDERYWLAFMSVSFGLGLLRAIETLAGKPFLGNTILGWGVVLIYALWGIICYARAAKAAQHSGNPEDYIEKPKRRV